MNFLTTLLEQYAIMESLDSIIKSNPLISEHIITGYHANALPDGNKSDRLLNHVLKLHNNGEITPETAYLLKPHLTALHLSNQLNKISSLKTLDDHRNATIGMNTNTKKERVDTNTPTIFENKHIIVRQHLNHESAIKGAILDKHNLVAPLTREPRKAQWCVSTDNEDGKDYFDSYTKNGKYPLYTIHNKKTKRTTAFVADPSKDDDELEIRDEQDNQKSPYHLLVNNPGIEHSKIGDFFKQYHPDSIDMLKTIPRDASEDELADLLMSHSKTVSRSVLDHPNITPPLINNALNSTFDRTRLLAIRHPNASEENITKALDDDNGEVVEAALSHPKVTEEHITKALTHGRLYVRKAAINHPKATEEHVTTALDDDSPHLRQELFRDPHPKITEEHITKALDDDDSIVNTMAMTHPKVTEEHITKALTKTDTNYENVRFKAITHPLANDEHINTALDDPSDFIRRNALNHPNVTSEHVAKALNDKNHLVRRKAIEHPLATKTDLRNLNKTETDELNKNMIITHYMERSN